LGDDGFGPKRLAERLTASNLGTTATLRSTALLARDGGSWEKLTISYISSYQTLTADKKSKSY
jgi:hypothetical protein